MYRSRLTCLVLDINYDKWRKIQRLIMKVSKQKKPVGLIINAQNVYFYEVKNAVELYIESSWWPGRCDATVGRV